MLRFSQSFVMEPVILENPDTGEIEHYAIRELDGNQADAHMNDMSKRTRYDAKGNPSGLKNFTNLQASMIARGMYEATLDKDENDEWRVVELGKKVSEKFVQGLPSRIRMALHKRLTELSGLSDSSENDPLDIDEDDDPKS